MARLLARHSSRKFFESRAEPDSSAGEGVERADLFRDEGGIALGQNEDLGAESDRAGRRRAVGQRREGLEDGHVGGVEAGPARLGGVRHDDVVEHVELVVAYILDAFS